MFRVYDGRYLHPRQHRTLSDAMHHAQGFLDSEFSGRLSADWRSITIESKGLLLSKVRAKPIENYREVLIEVPSLATDNLIGYPGNLEREVGGAVYNHFDNAVHRLRKHFPDQTLLFTDIVAHYRTTDHRIKGKKYLLIQEIQSDYFQQVRRELHSADHESFTERAPFSGTSNWVALAIRDALDKIVKEGGYAGIAWLDGRMQTRLEKDFDPETPDEYFGNTLFTRFFKEGKTDITAEGTITQIRRLVSDERISMVEGLLDTELNKDFIKLFKEGGGTGVLDPELADTSIESFKIKRKDTLLVEGVDYIKSQSSALSSNVLVAFRKGLFESSDLLESEREFVPSMMFSVKRKNPFALFQDKIIPSAVSKQMKHNGLKATITHNKDLGFHVMPIDEKSQLLIKEKGQPTYAKAVPLEGEYKPLPKAESVPLLNEKVKQAKKKLDKNIVAREKVKVGAAVEKKEVKLLSSQLEDLEKRAEKFSPLSKVQSIPTPAVQPFYSSLERLIEKQRPLDKRNGKQWSKYLITQGMSEAEMKHTGVWELLEKSKTKDISKETLLDTIDKNRATVYPLEVQEARRKVEGLVWPPDETNIEITDKNDWMYASINSREETPSQVYLVQQSTNAKYGVVRIVSDAKTSYRVAVIRREHVFSQDFDSISDAQHIAESWWIEMSNPKSKTDWSALTIESKGIVHGGKTVQYDMVGKTEIPEKYMEVLVALPNFASKKLKLFDDKTKDKVERLVNEHFRSQLSQKSEEMSDNNISPSDIVSHYRTSDYQIEGGKYLLIQEIQSDYFQTMRKLSQTKSGLVYRELLETIPYSGTSNWIALAVRDALDKAVKEGGYDGIAWLDGRMQTWLEHGYDPDVGTVMRNSILGTAYINPIISKDGNDIKIEHKRESSADDIHSFIKSEGNEGFVKVLQEGGIFFEGPPSAKQTIASVTIRGKSIPVVEGVDYFITMGMSPHLLTHIPPHRVAARRRHFSKYLYAFREGIFDKEMDFYDEEELINDVTFLAYRENKFALYQDNIIPKAVSTQMKRNGITPTITHNDDLGFHVMPLSETAQLLIKTRGQPTYAKAIPLEGEFQPLPKAESLPATQPFYSSLERLIKGQRETDIRNGTQWRKYLIGQDMSQAEMKVTGVWDVLEKSKTKEITKERLLKVINDPENDLTSKSISVERNVIDRGNDPMIRWDEDFEIEKFDEEDYPKIIYHLTGRVEGDKYAHVAAGQDDSDSVQVGIIRITSDDGNVKYGYTVYTDILDDTMVGDRFSDSLEDIKHIAQSNAIDALYEYDRSNETYSGSGSDWKNTTVEREFNHLGNETPENYQERIVMVTEFRRGVTHHLDKGIHAADNSLESHLESGIAYYETNAETEDIDIDIRNAAVHYRTSDYEIEGDRYLLIQEIQSDFFQKLRKVYKSTTGNKAYKKFLEETPYSGTSNWVALAFRHALDAVVKEGDYKGIAWLDGRIASRLENANLKLFQDKIVTEAVRKQMRNNGVTPVITHNKKYSFHVMPLSDKDQLLIKTRGQPTYAKAIPLEGEFKPLPKAESSKALTEKVKVAKKKLDKAIVASQKLKVLEGEKALLGSQLKSLKKELKKVDFEAKFAATGTSPEGLIKIVPEMLTGLSKKEWEWLLSAKVGDKIDDNPTNKYPDGSRKSESSRRALNYYVKLGNNKFQWTFKDKDGVGLVTKQEFLEMLFKNEIRELNTEKVISTIVMPDTNKRIVLPHVREIKTQENLKKLIHDATKDMLKYNSILVLPNGKEVSIIGRDRDKDWDHVRYYSWAIEGEGFVPGESLPITLEKYYDVKQKLDSRKFHINQKKSFEDFSPNKERSIRVAMGLWQTSAWTEYRADFVEGFNVTGKLKQGRSIRKSSQSLLRLFMEYSPNYKGEGLRVLQNKINLKIGDTFTDNGPSAWASEKDYLAYFIGAVPESYKTLVTIKPGDTSWAYDYKPISRKMRISDKTIISNDELLVQPFMKFRVVAINENVEVRGLKEWSGKNTIGPNKHYSYKVTEYVVEPVPEQFKPLPKAKSLKDLRSEIATTEKELDKALIKREKVKVAEAAEKKEVKLLSSQLEDLEKRAEKFSPPSKAESVPLVQPFYSSLERLIEQQRPLDKRNGKQWSKYLITQGMSEAEMKHTGVWELLEKSGRKDIPKEKLLATIDKNRHVVKSYEVHKVGIHRSEIDVLHWSDVLNEELFYKKDEAFRKVMDRDVSWPPHPDTRIFKFQYAAGERLVILRVVPPLKIQKTGSNIYYALYEKDTRILHYHQHADVSDAQHYAQSVWYDRSDDRLSSRDWRFLTVEGKHLIKDDAAVRNYREVLIQLPDVGMKNVKEFDTGLLQAVENSLVYHFQKQLGRISKEVGEIAVADTIAHYRTTDYYIDGDRYLLIQEIQSDYFQKIKKLASNDAPYKNFIEKTPYSGTSNWVALAARDALDKVVKEGGYKGIAWLDGRTQTRLEKDFDPELPYLKKPGVIFSTLYQEPRISKRGEYSKITHTSRDDRGYASVKTKGNEDFINLLNDGGSFFGGHRTEPKLGIVGVNVAGKSITLVEGIDYIHTLGIEGDDPELINFYAFRKDLLTDKNFKDREDPILKSNVFFNVIGTNFFALFQDKIVTEAIRKQMQRNGLETAITHNDDLGFHVMPLSETAQLLIKTRGQTNLRESNTS